MKLAEDLEQELAMFHNAEAALLFNSGYDLNMGLFACVPQPGDVVLYDELIHQSVREGLKLSRATSRSFRHNDPAALDEALREWRQAEVQSGKRGNVIIAVESVYSMDGHCAPLAEFCEVASAAGAVLIIDEAHGTGVFGPGGRGWTAELGLERHPAIHCRVHTFGKGLGVHGAVVVGSQILRDYLINYAWPLVYSTAIPAHSLLSIRCAYTLMQRSAADLQRHLKHLTVAFHRRLSRLPKSCALTSPSPIQGIIVPGNAPCVTAALELQRRGFHVLPIRSPTVPQGAERLRIILHAHNSLAEVEALMDAVEEVLAGLAAEVQPASRL